MTVQKSTFFISPTADCAKIMKIHISARTWLGKFAIPADKNKASGRCAVKFACVNRIWEISQQLPKIRKIVI